MKDGFVSISRIKFLFRNRPAQDTIDVFKRLDASGCGVPFGVDTKYPWSLVSRIIDEVFNFGSNPDTGAIADAKKLEAQRKHQARVEADDDRAIWAKKGTEALRKWFRDEDSQSAAQPLVSFIRWWDGKEWHDATCGKLFTVSANDSITVTYS